MITVHELVIAAWNGWYKVTRSNEVKTSDPTLRRRDIHGAGSFLTS